MANSDESIKHLTEQFESVGISLPTGIIKLEGVETCLFDGIKVDRLQIENYLHSEDNRVLFLGEGNFTFSAAVASFRGTWNNIIPSELSLVDDAKDYNKLFRKMITKMAAHKDTTDSDFRGYVRAFVQLNDKDWIQRKVNAVELNETWNATGEPSKPNALFFQCPFDDAVDKLVSKFFKSAKDFQINDNLLFLSVCTKYYLGRYQLKPEYEGYELLGADNSFCKQMFVRGYEHQTGYDPDGYGTLSTDLLNSFVTVCYRRTESQTLAQQRHQLKAAITQASDVN